MQNLYSDQNHSVLDFSYADCHTECTWVVGKNEREKRERERDYD